MDTEFDIGLMYNVTLPAEVIDDFTQPLKNGGATIRLSERASIYAGMEWLLPTAIVVFISRKYFETLLEEAAKDHYVLLKSAFSRLLRKMVGKNREIQIQRITSKGAPQKLPEQSPGAVSIYIRTKDEQIVKFIFEDSLHDSQRELCLDAVFDIVRDHEALFPHDALSKAVDEAGLKSAQAVIMRYNPDSELWYLWEPILLPPPT